jgi:hypothetical protein
MSVSESSDPHGAPTDRRKLIAVVHADMVGYSRLIGLDDVGTLERLRALRSTLIASTGAIVPNANSICLDFDGRCNSSMRDSAHRHDSKRAFQSSKTSGISECGMASVPSL